MRGNELYLYSSANGQVSGSCEFLRQGFSPDILYLVKGTTL